MEFAKHNKLLTFVDSHRKITIAFLTVVFALAIGLVATASLWPIDSSETQQPTSQANQAPDAQKFYSPLTGLPVKDEKTTAKQVTAMMLGNSHEARPQSGIKEAGVVFEAIAEGGITRYLSLWQEARPKLVGPVRSVRPYYVEWFAAFDAVIGHVGGSHKALKEVRNGKYKDADEFFNGNFYYRATDRPSPHNVYITFDKIDAMNKSKGFTKSSFEGFARKLEAAGGKNATKISVTVSSADYNPSYVYNKGTNSYARSLGGVPHKDREKGQVAPKNIIVLKIPTHIGFEDGYREQMNTIGVGKAYIFMDGRVIEGFWNKANKKSQIRFYDKLGRTIALNPGQTWLTAIAPEKKVSWK